MVRMIIDEYFPEAYETNHITLADVLHKQESTDPKISEYYQRFGIDKVDWLESPGETILQEIETRFQYKYWDRKISGETMEQWQLYLQRTTDKIARKYCRALRLFAKYSERLDDDVIRKTTQSSSVDSNGSNTGKGLSYELPDTPVTLPTDATTGYAGSGSENSGANEAHSQSTTTIEMSGDIIDQLNRNIDGWRDIIGEIVDRYEECFLKIEWY